MRILMIQIITFSSLVASAQDLAKLTVTPQNGVGKTLTSINIEAMDYNMDEGRIALFEIGGEGLQVVPSQVEPGIPANLWFLFDNSGPEKSYVIRRVTATGSHKPRVSLQRNEQGTTLYQDNHPVLTYNHAEVYPPEGVDFNYRRSAFIHPVWSPEGEVLTSIQPPDHYHHYGIWNPWTKTTIDGREVDFWNLAKGQGTVKYAGYLSAVEGAVYAGFRVLHEHVFFAERGREKIAMNEVWDIRVWDAGIPGISLIDLTSTLNTPLQGGIIFNAYRYGGGIGYRATGRWHKDNCTVLTSEGKNRTEADGTSARWCIVEGESDAGEGRSGIIFLSHPSNRMHPEPMRVWPVSGNSGRGDLFFEFCPIRHKDWMLKPCTDYTLRYRMIVFDGRITPEEAERYWHSFAQAPLVRLVPGP